MTGGPFARTVQIMSSAVLSPSRPIPIPKGGSRPDRPLSDERPDLRERFVRVLDSPEMTFDDLRTWSYREVVWRCPKHRRQRFVASPINVVRHPNYERCEVCRQQAASVAGQLPRLSRYALFDALQVRRADSMHRRLEWKCPHCSQVLEGSLAAVFGPVDGDVQDDPDLLVKLCARTTPRTVAGNPVLVSQFVRTLDGETDPFEVITGPGVVGRRRAEWVCPSCDRHYKAAVNVVEANAANGRAVCRGCQWRLDHS